MKILLEYPTREDEVRILSKSITKNTELPAKRSQSKISTDELSEMQEFIVSNVHIDQHIYDYIGEILEATRGKNEYVSYGASTRAGLALRDGARICALLEGRDYVTPDDVKFIALDVLRHRIGRSYEALAEKISTDEIIREILESVRIP